MPVTKLSPTTLVETAFSMPTPCLQILIVCCVQVEKNVSRKPNGLDLSIVFNVASGIHRGINPAKVIFNEIDTLIFKLTGVFQLMYYSVNDSYFLKYFFFASSQCMDLAAWCQVCVFKFIL